MFAFIIKFLINRFIQVRINGVPCKPSQTPEIKNGVRQESALSVMLFLIGINDITKDIKQPIKRIHLFADDFTITSGKTPNPLKELLQPPYI